MAKSLEFGTGGMRGIIGDGASKMNVLTIIRVSRAFSKFLLTKSDEPSVVIAYDNRKYSKLFAVASAEIFAEFNIKVWLFEEITPTPMLSYAVRELKATGGVVITASHNSKEYNGYKIYDESGCQNLPPEAAIVAELMEDYEKIAELSTPSENAYQDSSESIHKVVTNNPLINFVPEEVNSTYYDKAVNLRGFRSMLSDVNVAYTPLNGTGAIPVSTVLKKLEVGQLHIVKAQENPSPGFETCPSPNPEEDEAMSEGLRLCHELKEKGNSPDILMATDPDCDRIGIMVKKDEEYQRLDGNQVGVLLFDYLINSLKDKKILPGNPTMITTIVSTPMTEKIAQKNQINIEKVLTGFKYIGDRINEYESKGQKDKFIFGFEESCGYLAEPIVRDKDAISTSILIADMVGYYKAQGKTLIDRMNELYDEYGYFITSQESLKESDFPKNSGIDFAMQSLRASDATTVFKDITDVIDYEIPTGNLPSENVFEFNFENRSKAIIRPSGTEPKIKIYFFASANSLESAKNNLKDIKLKIMKLLIG